MDLLEGGNLKFQMRRHSNRFGMNASKFLIACIILALEDIHGQNVLHRDVKPENLVFDNQGYLRLTDFGISRLNEPNNRSSSGTPGYMSPEAINHQKQGFASDFFAVGAIAYQLMLRHKPYTGDKVEVRKKINAG